MRSAHHDEKVTFAEMIRRIGHVSCSRFTRTHTTQMKANQTYALPDTVSVTSELTLDDSWDATAAAGLIRSKCSLGDMPAFLFLGRKEAALLRAHLAQAFGVDSVSTLHGSYYMGLEVVEIDCDTFVHAGGRKATRMWHDSIAHRPAWKDRDTDTLWQLRL